jgi:hypothetical protein
MKSREFVIIIATDPGDHLRPLSFDEPGKYSEFFFTKN